MKEEILRIAEKTDWTLIKDQENIKFLQFQNGSEKLNIYYGTMTVQLLRRNLNKTVVNCKLETLRILFGVKERNPFKRLFRSINNKCVNDGGKLKPHINGLDECENCFQLSGSKK